MFLAESMQKCSRWIGAVSTEQLSVENQLCVEVYCSVQPRPFTVYFDSSLILRVTRAVRQRTTLINGVTEMHWVQMEEPSPLIFNQQISNVLCWLSPILLEPPESSEEDDNRQ